ncbi:MAG: flippase [Cyanobacteria bacterium P01_C01_bin.118]
MRQSKVLNKLMRGAGAALTIQIVSAVILYISQILLARWMGTVDYGVYEYAIAVGLFWAFIAGFGLPTAVLRFISAYKAKEDWPHLQGMIWGSWWQTLLIGIVSSLGGTGILLWLHSHNNLGDYRLPLTIGIWTIPIVALTSLQKEIIRAFQKIVLSYGPSLILQPLVLVTLAIMWQLRRPLTSTVAISLSLLSGLIVLILQWLIFQRSLDRKIRQARPAYEITRWWKTAVPLMLFGGSFMVLNYTDTFMIGLFLDARQVGIYSAAMKTSSWVLFILVAVNAISAPMIASLYAEGDDQGLQQLVSTIARWMFYPALVTAMGLISFAGPVLHLFGPEFVAARNVLIILIFGELVNVGAGSVGYLMTMTGHQNQSVVVMAVAALVNVILNWVGIQLLGIVGAALATAFSMVLWNIWLYALVVRYLGVRPSIIDAFQ